GRTNQVISRSYITGYAPIFASGIGNISPDGRLVTYRSYAGEIVPGVTNTSGEMYLYDRATGTTTLLGTTQTGMIANSRAQTPVFSGDSHTLVFKSFASDFFAFDFNQYPDLFSWRLVTTNAAQVFAGQMVYAPTSGKSPTLTWPVVEGKSYQVQF